ncbi:MAG: DUF4824 family protein [Desulfuromonas sp.]|nr:DUF4824 family protein [Desulfuromonas sp.]
MSRPRRTLLQALALLLAVNAFVLTGVAYNRRGTPDATLVMTERELPLAWNWSRAENSGVALQLNWNQPREEWRWFDRAKLAELGITAEGLDEEDASRRHQSLPVKAFAVLEYEGPAWERFKARVETERTGLDGEVAAARMTAAAAERRRKEIAFALRAGSRLFAVDAGGDAEALRTRYPDRARYLIAPAEVRAVVAWTDKHESEKPERRIHGMIERILIDTVHLPRQFHAPLEGIPERERLHIYGGYYDDEVPARAHYQVQIAFGRRYEPWVESIEPLEAAAGN